MKTDTKSSLPAPEDTPEISELVTLYHEWRQNMSTRWKELRSAGHSRRKTGEILFFELGCRWHRNLPQVIGELRAVARRGEPVTTELVQRIRANSRAGVPHPAGSVKSNKRLRNELREIKRCLDGTATESMRLQYVKLFEQGEEAVQKKIRTLEAVVV